MICAQRRNAVFVIIAEAVRNYLEYSRDSSTYVQDKIFTDNRRENARCCRNVNNKYL